MTPRPGASTPVATGVDVGGSKVTAVVLAPDGTCPVRRTRPTPADDVEATVATVLELTREVHTEATVAVGVGAAGLVTREGKVLFAPNLPWRGVDVAAAVAGATGVPVVVENDCTAAAYGEWRLGAARGLRDVLYVGVGTGIGGGVVLDGELRRGAHGFAGEIGHIVVEPDGPPCGCGNRGCWETVASGMTITRDGRRAVTRHAHSLIASMAEGSPASVTGELVTEAARLGDPTATGILTEAGTRLGVGIAGLVNVLDVAMVVVGGGVAEAGALMLEPARRAFADSVQAHGVRPEVPIVAAALGPDGAAIGSALLALHGAA